MQPRLIFWLMWLAAAAFAASWFLPVLEDMRGWGAFHAAMAPLIPSEGGGGSLLRWDDAVPQVLSALTNVMFLVLFGQWLARQMFKPSMFVKLALVCVILNLYWLVQAIRAEQLGDLLYGYYLWLGAFAMLLAAAILNVFSSRRTSRTPTDDRPS